MFNPGAPATVGGAVGGPGKAIQSQKLALGQKDTITGSEPLSRMMGQYGKGHSYVGGAAPDTNMDPTKHAGSQAIRGGQGGVKAHPRQGGIGPGPNGSTGSETSYPKMEE
jgi:hypothetical protein